VESRSSLEDYAISTISDGRRRANQKGCFDSTRALLRDVLISTTLMGSVVGTMRPKDESQDTTLPPPENPRRDILIASVTLKTEVLSGLYRLIPM